MNRSPKPMQRTSRYCLAVWLLASVATPGCAVRRPTLSRSHEAAFGLGGVAHLLTGLEYSEDEPRYGAGAAAVWRLSYARCLNKEESAVCFEIPVDGTSAMKFTSPNPTAPGSYSMLALTPGLRFESDRPPVLLPINFIALGLGAARHVSSRTLLDGTRAQPQRATTFAVRFDLGLTMPLRNRLGLRAGVFVIEGADVDWFQRLGVLPAGESLGSRIGGYGVLYKRR
jgi:hypothetical protein